VDQLETERGKIPEERERERERERSEDKRDTKYIRTPARERSVRRKVNGEREIR